MSVWVCGQLILLGFYLSAVNEFVAHIDAGKAQAVGGNVFWIKTPVGNIYLNDLEQNPQHEQGNEGNEDNPLAFIPKG